MIKWKPPRFTHESAGRIPSMPDTLYRIRDNEQNVFYKKLDGQERFSFKNAIRIERVLNIILDHNRACPVVPLDNGAKRP
jgi:hypothetical protein